MWTLEELNRIDESVRSRYEGIRVITQEKVGLSLKEPENDSKSQTPVRRLTYELCGMHYTSPQYNLILLQDKVNELAGRDLVLKATYSAPHHQINFYLSNGTVRTFDSSELVAKGAFLNALGVGS